MSMRKKYLKIAAYVLAIGLFVCCVAGSLYQGYVKYDDYQGNMAKLQQKEDDMKTEEAELDSKIVTAQKEIENMVTQEAAVKEELNALEDQEKEKEMQAQHFVEILSELDEYRGQLEQVREENQELLNFTLNPLTYNFDKELTDLDARKSSISKSVSSVVPNLFTWVLDVSTQGMNENNVDVMVSVNQTAESQMLHAVSDINHTVDNMNAQVEMYQSFWETDDLAEQFSNLQVLQQITAEKPIDSSILKENQKELFRKLKRYYYTLQSICDMYEFVLTDSEENQDYLLGMEEDLVKIEALFEKYGQTLELDMEKYGDLVLPQLVEIKNTLDEIGSGAVVLPSIPISNQGNKIIPRSGGGARVYYKYKDMREGKKLVFLEEVGGYHNEVTAFIYNSEGDPIYARMNDGYAYFFHGQVVEADTDQDLSELYDAAVWLYQNFETMTNDEYFAHSLVG